MQIGQILVEQRWVDPDALARALAEQPAAGMRICSLLIARGQLDPDHAARALATQHGIPGVLQKHLDNRDRSLAALLPAAVAHAWIALPVGRTRHGELIVCVRGPGAELTAALAAALPGAIVVAVAPARQLEQLVADSYGPPDASIDVDLETRQIPVIAMAGDGLGDLGSMTLVELDDSRVVRDPSQSGSHPAIAPRTMTPYPPRTLTPHPPRTLTPHPPRTLTPPARPAPGNALAALPLPLDAALIAIERAAAPDDATAQAMRYLAGRFACALLFTISSGAALGVSGHGDHLSAELIEAIAVPLGAPSVVQVAHATRRAVIAAPEHAGVIQDRLARALGSPRVVAAAPIEVGGRVLHVIAVGDTGSDATAAARDLERVTTALAAALTAAFGRSAAP